MSIRKFIFCDICNPQCIRIIEYRRAYGRHDRNGRRISDSRAWYEGELVDAVNEAGWRLTPEGLHICHTCQALNV